ncbi:MAG: FAD-dependent oxidoreductase [Burkholderiaceae bacterium]|jgi:protoporphyrinogen oxidase
MKKIAIIGGGWAGLACTHALKQRKDPSAEIWLFEASPHAGGRARGIDWETELGETAVDNGQHLLIGAYSQTWQLLRDAGVLLERAWSDSVLHWASYTPDRPAGYELLRVPPQSWPWRFFGQSFPAATDRKLARPWGLLSRLSLANLLRHAIQSNWQAQGTALEWLDQLPMPEGVRHRFWRPLIEGALNTDWAEASAYVCLRVIKDSLTGPSGSTNCWHPVTNLSQDAVEPLWRWLHREQTRLIRRCRIASIRRHTALSHSSGRGTWQLQAHPSSQDQALTLGLENQAFDAVVLATPAHEAARLWHQSGLEETPALARVRSLDWRGVMTLYIHLSQTQATLLKPVTEWLCSLPGLNQRTHVGLARSPAANGSQVVSMVASGLRKDDDRAVIADSLWQAAAHYLKPLGIANLKALPHRFTDDPRATWACTAAFTDSAAYALEDSEDASLTGIAGLFRAADDLSYGYPACIEAAVRSGQACAQSIHGQLNPG